MTKRKKRRLKIKLEVEKCLITHGEMQVRDIIYQLGKHKHYQVTPFELGGIIRSSERIEKISTGLYAFKET